ncbi:methylglyoxal synthase [Haploplasma axanthum]|uniref:Methylglyoxal synthase n=1 Tax=Haploplasma axanthum TaxID=29552 RepID=A0A449BF61_HAPAX|nr:methylglyoxal synthase [Haploplasma axanthum]VEU81076.1 Methylglyoxal synthase [Haploplasma axanthum]
MNIALIAHDKKKQDIIEFVKRNEEAFSKHKLYATGTTGKLLMEATKLTINRKKSGPLGGDQEIGSMVANGKLDLIIFFRDPLTAQAHEPDITALLRLCDLYEVPLATNKQSAELFLEHIKLN